MKSLLQSKPLPLQTKTNPAVNLGDVRKLTGSDPNGSGTDDGTISGYQRKQ